MKKQVIFGVSSYSEKYYFDPVAESLPINIKNHIKEIGIHFVNKVKGILTIGFYENSSLFIDYSFLENDLSCDEIGAKLEIEKIKKEEKELLLSLKLWHRVFILEKQL